MTPFNFAQRIFHLAGKPLDLKSYPYLEAIYNTKAPEVALFTGRQVSKCGSVDQMVLMHDGSRKAWGNIEPGDRVCSVSCDFKVGVNTVTRVYPRQHKPCLKLLLRSGVSVVLTPEHRLMTGAGFTAVSDLLVGSRIANVLRLPAKPVGCPDGITDDEAKILGHMIGNGCCGLSKVWEFTSACAEALAEFAALTDSPILGVYHRGISSLASRVRMRTSSPGVVASIKYGLHNKYSYEKFVPLAVFDASDETVRLFLSRLWSTDGMIKASAKGFPTISYCSTSERLAWDVVALLRRLGILGWVTQREAGYTKGGVYKRCRDAYIVRITGKPSIETFYRLLSPVLGKPEIPYATTRGENNNRLTLPPEANAIMAAECKSRRFMYDGQGVTAFGLTRNTNKYPLTPGKAERYAAYLRHRAVDPAVVAKFESFYKNDVWWDAVETIEEVGDQEVCDIEVENDHTFLLDGVVSHNSTTLANIMVLNGITQPGTSQLYVAPLQDQAEVFASQRLKDFLIDSPIVKQGFFSGGNVIDQVFRKRLQNNSWLACGYSQRSADRLRGRSAGKICLDETQDIVADIIPIIKELSFRQVDSSFWTCGTPKSMANHIEKIRARSTGSEWAVKCTKCNAWNHEWTERNIGRSGIVCDKCGGGLNTDTGRWVARRKMDTGLGADSRVQVECYRIPQLIVKPVMDDSRKFFDLHTKLKSYDTAQFRNEVLGLPAESGVAPITIDQLRKCCLTNRTNELPTVRDPSRPPLIVGVDWAFNGEKSYTFAVIGAWNPFPSRFDVYFWKIFKGVESDSVFQMEWIKDAVKRCDIQLVCADWGAGHVQNLQLANSLGSDRLMQVWHTGMKGTGASRAARVKWEPKTQKFHLARTRVLTDTFETLRLTQVSFPRAEECGELFDHILAEQIEYSPLSNLQCYTNIEPDDGLHSLTYAMLGSEMFLNGSFRGHAGSTSSANSLIDEMSQYDNDPLIDSYYS